MPTDHHWHRQQMPHHALYPPALRIIRQLHHTHRHQDVVRQCRYRVEHLVGDQFQTGRILQVQITEQLAETLFLGTLERVPFKHPPPDWLAPQVRTSQTHTCKTTPRTACAAPPQTHAPGHSPRADATGHAYCSIRPSAPDPDQHLQADSGSCLANCSNLSVNLLYDMLQALKPAASVALT